MDAVQGGEPLVEYRWRAAKLTWSKISTFIFLRKIVNTDRKLLKEATELF